MQKKISVLWTVLICLIAVLITFEITFIVMTIDAKKSEYELSKAYNDSVAQIREEFASLNEMYESLPEEYKNSALFEKLAYIDTYYRSLYVGKIDEERLAYYLMNGYIQGVGDRYGAYYTANELESLFQEADGKLYGIGVSVVYNEEHSAIEILSVIKDSPADKVGIQAGDIVTAIDGVEVNNDNYYESVNKVKGEKGTSVNLTILREGTQLTFSPVRDEIKIISVTYRKYSFDQTIGIVSITEFNNTTASQLKDAVDTLLKDGCKSIVFDVRNNPGGTLDGVIESLDYLLPEGNLCIVRNAYGEVTQTLTSDAECVDPSVKMAVLINENTASAGELFASAMRDYKRATLVGMNSFGKGTMQATYMLPDGAGLKISTNTYNPPCDVNYDGIGIAPHVEIDLTEEAKNKNFFKLTDQEDNQLLEACCQVGYNK